MLGVANSLRSASRLTFRHAPPSSCCGPQPFGKRGTLASAIRDAEPVSAALKNETATSRLQTRRLQHEIRRHALPYLSILYQLARIMKGMLIQLFSHFERVKNGVIVVPGLTFAIDLSEPYSPLRAAKNGPYLTFPTNFYSRIFPVSQRHCV